jgi:hypothetical protein
METIMRMMVMIELDAIQALSAKWSWHWMNGEGMSSVHITGLCITRARRFDYVNLAYSILTS